MDQVASNGSCGEEKYRGQEMRRNDVRVQIREDADASDDSVENNKPELTPRPPDNTWIGVSL